MKWVINSFQCSRSYVRLCQRAPGLFKELSEGITDPSCWWDPLHRDLAQQGWVRVMDLWAESFWRVRRKSFPMPPRFVVLLLAQNWSQFWAEISGSQEPTYGTGIALGQGLWLWSSRRGMTNSGIAGNHITEVGRCLNTNTRKRKHLKRRKKAKCTACIWKGEKKVL